MKLIRSMSLRSNSGLQVPNSSETSLSMSPVKKVRDPVDLNTITLEEIAEVVREDMENADLSHVMRYGQMMLELGLGSKQRPKSPRSIYLGTLLMDWAAHKGYPLSTALERMLGYAHSETWLGGGAHSEAYSLARAKELYEKVLLDLEQAKDPSVWLEYSQILLFQGDYELGSRTTQLVANKFADTPNSPIYLLNAAAMFFAAGKFDAAGKHMFQSIQSGPPKFFTKSEMLFMLSRTFEQSGTLDDSRAEDGYFMVFQNLDGEEVEQAGGSYEAWLNSTSTWARVADKCVMYGLYSLAADLYGQALVRDPAAFNSSKVWFRYSKASYRCGKSSDAQLAVKQAIALDPENALCIKTLENWNTNGETIKTLVSGPLADIIEIISGNSAAKPKNSELEESSPEKEAVRLQAYYKGEAARRTDVSSPLAARMELAEGLQARAGIVARVPVNGGESYMVHMMLLTGRVHLASTSVKSVQIYDMKTTRMVVVKLKSPFLLPLVDYRESQTGLADDVSVNGTGLEVVLTHEPEKSPLKRAGSPSDPDDVLQQYAIAAVRRLEDFEFNIKCDHVSSKMIHAGSRPSSPEEEGAGSVKDVILVHLRFVHKKSGKFSMRQISLNFDSSGGLAVGEAKRDVFGDSRAKSRSASPEAVPRAAAAATPSSRERVSSSQGARVASPSLLPPQSAGSERKRTPSLLSPVREDYEKAEDQHTPDRLADDIGETSGLQETPLVRPIARVPSDKDSVSMATNSQLGDEEETSIADDMSHGNRSFDSAGSSYSGSTSFTYTTGSYSYDDSVSRSAYTEDDEAPNPRGVFKFFDMMYMYRAYHPGEEAVLDVSYEMGTSRLGDHSASSKAVQSGLKTMTQSMAIHVLQVSTNRLFIFVLPPEEMPSQRLINQMVFFLLSVAKRVSESANVFDMEMDLVALPVDMGSIQEWSVEAPGDISESSTWNISGHHSVRSSPVPFSAPSRRAQTVRRRTMRGVNVLGRHVLVSSHSPHPGVVRIYVIDPLMRSIIPPNMRAGRYDDDLTEYSRDSNSLDSRNVDPDSSKKSRQIISDWNDGNELTDDEGDMLPSSPAMKFTKSESSRGSWQRSQSSSIDEQDMPKTAAAAQPSKDFSATSATTGTYDDSMSTSSSYIYQDDQSSFDGGSSYATSMSASQSIDPSLDSGTHYTAGSSVYTDNSSYVSEDSSYTEDSASQSSYSSYSSYSTYTKIDKGDADSSSMLGSQTSADASMTSSVLSPSVQGETKESTGPRGGPGSLSHAAYHDHGGVDGEPSELTFLDESMNSSLDDSSVLSEEPRREDDATETSILRTNSNSLSAASLLNEVIPEEDEEDPSNVTESEDESRLVAPGVYRVVYGDSSDSSADMLGSASHGGSRNKGSLTSVAEESGFDDDTSVASSVSYFSHEVQQDDDSSSKFVNVDGDIDDESLGDNSHWTHSSNGSLASSAMPEPSSSLHEGSASSYSSRTPSYDSHSYLEGTSTEGSSYVTGSTSYVTGSESYITGDGSSLDLSSSYIEPSQSSYTTDPSSYTGTGTGPSSYTATRTGTDTDTSRLRGSSADAMSAMSQDPIMEEGRGEENEQPIVEQSRVTLDEWIAPIPEPDDRSMDDESSNTFDITIKDDDASARLSDESTVRSLHDDSPASRGRTGSMESDIGGEPSAAGPETSMYSAAESTFGESTYYSEASALFPNSTYDDDSVSVLFEGSEDYSTAASLFPEDSKVLSKIIPSTDLFIEETAYTQVDGYDYDGDEQGTLGDDQTIGDTSVGSLGGSISEYPAHSRFTWRDAKLAGEVVDDALMQAIQRTGAIPRPPPRPAVDPSTTRRQKSGFGAYSSSSDMGTTPKQQGKSELPFAGYADDNSSIGDIDGVYMEESTLSVHSESVFSGLDGEPSFDFGNAGDRTDSLELRGRRDSKIRRGSTGSYEGITFDEGIESARSKASKAQAMNFLAWQNKRLEAIDYIAERVSSAIRVVTTRDAFTYLKRRVVQAQLAIQKKKEIPPPPEEAPPSDDDLSVESGRGSKRGSRRSRRALRNGSPSAVRFSDEGSPGPPAVKGVPGSSPPSGGGRKKPPLRRASTLTASMMGNRSPISFASLLPRAAADDKSGSSDLQIREQARRKQEEEKLRADLERAARVAEEARQLRLAQEEEALSKMSPTDALSDPIMLLKVLNRRQQCMPLSWTGQLQKSEDERDQDKKSVQWEDGLNSGQFGGGPSKGKPQRLTREKKSKKMKMRTKSPVDFLEDPADDSALVFDKSIADYGRVGYSAGSCEYLQVWNSKVKGAVDKFRTVAQLNRAVEMLRRNVGKDFNNELSRAEALVGLGETKGSPAEALGVLRDSLFREEAINVCRSMPLKEVARVLEDACKHGLAAFGHEFDQAAMFTSSGRKIGMSSNEAMERARNKKLKDAELYEKFREIVHKILDSGLSSEVINHIAQLQGESDPTASFFASASFVAPAPQSPEPVSNIWKKKTASDILSPDHSTSHYDTRAGESTLLPDIYSSNKQRISHISLASSAASSVSSGRRRAGDAHSDDGTEASTSTVSTRHRNEVAAMSQSLNLQRLRDPAVASPATSAPWGNTTGMVGLKSSQHMRQSSPGALRLDRTIEMMMKPAPSSAGDTSSPTRRGGDAIVSTRDVYKARQKQLLSLSPSYGVFKKQQEKNRSKF